MDVPGSLKNITGGHPAELDPSTPASNIIMDGGGNGAFNTTSNGAATTTTTAGGVDDKWSEVYAAGSVREGLRAIFRVVPYWLPVVAVGSGVGVYCAVFRVRLFLTQWRIAERQRVERKYDLLDNLRGVSMMGPVGALEPLADEDDEDDDEESNDETMVSMADVDEYRSSLGIRLPRDEDLLGSVEKMLMVDPIVDGWVLYRTTAGIIRFMNLNTQELFFFHPGKKAEQAHIEEELKKRNRQQMETKYNFSYEDEGMNSFSMAGRSGGTGGGGGGGGYTACSVGVGGGAPAGPSPLNFGDDDVASDDELRDSTFKRLFGFFLEKEQRRIEQDVARARGSVTHRTTSAPGANTAATSGGGGGSGASHPISPVAHHHGGAVPADGMDGSNNGNSHRRLTSPSGQRSASGGGGLASSWGSEGARRQLPASPSYRVVSSSSIQPGRGGGD